MTATRLGGALAGVVAGLVIGPLGGGLVHSVAAAPSCPPAAHHVEIVVEHSWGGTLSACVGFSGASISGEEVVRDSGIQYDMQPYGGLGAAVCQLDNEPNPEPSGCFGSGGYWELFVSRGCGAWVSSGTGVSSLQLDDGDLEGFHYVSSSGSPPPGPTGYCPPVSPPPIATMVSPPPPATVPAARRPAGPGPGASAPSSASTTSLAPTPTPAVSAAALPDTGVAALPPNTPGPSAGVAGPLQRTGQAPPSAPTRSPAWAYVLGVAMLAVLAGLLAWRLRRRQV